MKLFFDLDGPLLDNRNKYHRLYLDLLAPYGGERLDRDHYWELKRHRVSELEILGRTGHAARYAEYEPARRQNLESARYLDLDRVFSFVDGVLDTLSARHELYLVTLRKRRDLLFEQLERLGLLHRFERVFSEPNNDGTPDVKVRLIAGLVAGREAEACLVGDTELDIEAGRRLGICSVGVCSGIRARAPLQAEKPDILLGSLAELCPTRRAPKRD